MIDKILVKVDEHKDLTKDDAIELLNIDNKTPDYYKLICKSNTVSRIAYNNKGYLFAQIGLNAEPCSVDCAFCSFGISHYSVKERKQLTINEVKQNLDKIDFTKIDSLFLMTTADYSIDKYIEIGKWVKQQIPQNIRLVANIGDFNNEIAKKLKEAGFNCFYHIVRLRESIDTLVKVEDRIKTIEAGISNGLELYYCVEPIGIEHSYDEIAEEMIRAKKYNVNVMAVMWRVNVEGTKFFGLPEVSEYEMAKILAVTRLVTNPKRSMNIHEPQKLSLIAGANQLYAEICSNPRDTSINTSENRGNSIEKMTKYLTEAGWNI